MEKKLNTEKGCLKTSIHSANKILPLKKTTKIKACVPDKMLNNMTERKRINNIPEYKSIDKEVHVVRRQAK